MSERIKKYPQESVAFARTLIKRPGGTTTVAQIALEQRGVTAPKAKTISHLALHKTKPN